mgnify:CR=1 FL=1
MSTKADMAIAFHDKGYNCAQAVACSFCQEFGVAEEEMFRIAEGLRTWNGNDGSMWSTFRNDDDHRTGKQCRRTGKRQTDKR